MLEEMLKMLREKSPLIHNIKIMLQSMIVLMSFLHVEHHQLWQMIKKKLLKITSICTGLNINIGTLNTRTIESMVIAGKKANELHHPVVLDPVGVEHLH